jgi:hypothetical protein
VLRSPPELDAELGRTLERLAVEVNADIETTPEGPLRLSFAGGELTVALGRVRERVADLILDGTPTEAASGLLQLVGRAKEAP